MTLEPHNVLITGASQGLGRALAFELGRQGARVVGVARGRQSLDATIRDLKASGIDAWGVVDDVGRDGAATAIAAQAAALAGPVDLLIHCASSLGLTPLRPLLDIDESSFADVVRTNLTGPFALTKAIAGPMALRRRGTIVFISSDAAIEAYPTWGAYSATKAAADHLSRVWSAEVGSSGVRVLSIDPGEMDTQMHAAAMPDADPSTLRRPEQVASRVVRLLDRTDNDTVRLVA